MMPRLRPTYRAYHIAMTWTEFSNYINTLFGLIILEDETQVRVTGNPKEFLMEWFGNDKSAEITQLKACLYASDQNGKILLRIQYLQERNVVGYKTAGIIAGSISAIAIVVTLMSGNLKSALGWLPIAVIFLGGSLLRPNVDAYPSVLSETIGELIFIPLSAVETKWIPSLKEQYGFID